MAEENYQLIVIEGPEPGHSFQLGLETVIIGRDKYSDIVFDHPQVSRHHVRMTRAEGGYMVQDRDSTNGTFVDGKRLGDQPVLLQPGMTVGLGSAVRLRFQSLSAVDPMATVVSSSLVEETVLSEPGTLPGIQDTVTLVAAESVANPYVGPRAFEPDERQFFYGRDDEIAILAGQVMSRRASVFFAQSGAGKSSLLRAGLIPDLTRKAKVGRGPRARVIQKMRVMPILSVGYKATEEQLALTDNVYVLGALLSLFPEKPVNELASLTLCEGLAPYFEQVNGKPAGDGGQKTTSNDSNLSTLLIFDQFEELFTYHPEQWPKREDFFRQVNQALEVYPDLHVVFTMREDYIAELTPFANLLPDQLRARFRLERLKKDAALQAITAPAKKAGRHFAEGVAEELVDNLRRGQPKQDRAGGQVQAEATLGAYVEPVHLQIVCRQLWENLPTKRKVIESADVQAFGDVDQALTGFYESTLREVTARTDISERRLRAWFNNEVITPARTRGLVYRGEEETEGLPNAAVDILNDAYIIRADVRGGDIWYQLAHDRLVEPVLEANVRWRENYQNPLVQVTQTWLEAGRDRERLLQGSQLALAQAYADENPNELLPEEKEFLKESHRQEQLAAEQAARDAKRRRRTIIAAGVVAAILLVATIFAVIQSQLASENAALAEQEAQRAQENAELAALRAEAAQRAEESAVQAQEEALRAQEQAELEAARAEEAKADAEAQRAEAEVQRDEAERQKAEAERQREEAERQTRLSQAEGLAANALAEMSSDINDPSLALILALRAVNITRDYDGTVQDNARRALLEAVANTPPWQMNLPRYAHEGPVTRSAFSPDGQHIVSGSADGTAKIWDLSSGATEVTLTGHTGTVTSAAYSSDGAKVVTASEDGTARIWDATSGEELKVFRGHEGRVDHAAFDSRGERIVTAGSDSTAIVWDVESGEQLAVMTEHLDEVPAANFNPQGDRVVTAGADGVAIVWDAATGQEVLVLEGGDSYVIWAVYDDAGERIATASLDGVVRVWDAESGESLLSFEGGGEPMVSAMFSGDGEQLVAASWDGIAGLHDSRSGELIQTFAGHAGQVNFADFSPDGQRIMTTSDDRTVRIWDAATAEQLDVLGGIGGPAMDAAFNGDGTRLAVGAIDGTVVVWDVATGEDLVRFKAHDAEFLGLDFSPDGRLIVTAGEDGPARVWDAESGVLVRELEGHDGWATDAAFSPDSSSIATVGSDGQLMVFDAGSGELKVFRTDAALFGGLRFVVYSADGTKIATYSDDDEFIRIWGATSGDNFLSVPDKGGTESIHFSPDGNAILTSNTDGTIAIWDAFGGGEIDSLRAHPNFVRSAAFSPDGFYIVTASDDTTARVFDVESGDEEYTLLGHGNWLTSAAFSPDGRLIASTDVDGVTKLWNIRASALVPEVYHEDEPPIRLAAYTPDGQRLVTGADDGVVNVWDVESSQRLLSFDGFSLDEHPFDGSANLAIIPVTNENGSVDLWDVNSGEMVANLEGDYVWVSNVDISGDGQVAVTVGCDEFDQNEGICSLGAARVWDATSGEEILALPYDGRSVDEAKAFELSRDGTRLVIATCDEYDEEGFECLESSLTTWDTTTGDEVASWSVGPGMVWWIDYSPDRSGIFTTDGNETKLWDAATGELLQSVNGYYATTDRQGACVVTLTDNFSALIYDIRTGALLGTIAGHRDDITSIEFSPDSERLITSSWDGTARVWNARTGIEILNLNDHEGQVWRAHFSPDGTSIVTASEDGTAMIWPFAVDKLLELSEPAVQRYSPFLTPEESARFGLAGN